MRIVTVVLFCIVSFVSFAQDDVADSLIYYEIGGGRPFSGPPTYNVSTIIDGSATLRLSNTCGKFNYENSLKQFFTELEQGVDQSINTLVYAAQTQVINNLVWYVLRRADPNLADMLENAMLRYEEYLAIAIKDCETAQEEIRNGENPFYDYIKIGRKRGWDKQGDEAAAGNPNATLSNAQKQVKQAPDCIIWIGGEERLCPGKESIELLADVAKVGYQQLTGGGGASGTGLGELGVSDTRLKVVFPTEQSVVDFVTRAFGEIKITDVYEQTPGTLHGTGVKPILNENAKEILDVLNRVAGGDVLELSEADRTILSVPGLEMNRTLIKSLQELPQIEKTLFSERLSSEFSFLKTMEKLNLMRRILYAGMRDPDVYATSFANEIINRDVLPSIDSEYKLLLDEYELRQRVAQSSSSNLIRAYGTKSTSNRGPLGTQEPKPAFKDGGIIKK